MPFCEQSAETCSIDSQLPFGLDVQFPYAILQRMPPPEYPPMPALEADLKSLPVSEQAVAFLLLMARDGAWTRTADKQARALGLKNRDALRVLLLSLNLPQWGTLRRWFRVYTLVSKAEAGDSFAKQALAEGHNPSGTYRTLAGLLKLPPAAILHRGGTALLLPELIRELDQIQQRLRLEANRSAG